MAFCRTAMMSSYICVNWLPCSFIKWKFPLPGVRLQVGHCTVLLSRCQGIRRNMIYPLCSTIFSSFLDSCGFEMIASKTSQGCIQSCQHTHVFVAPKVTPTLSFYLASRKSSSNSCLTLMLHRLVV